MIEYALQDIDGNEYELNNDAGIDTVAKNSLTSLSDDFVWDQRIEQRSFLHGAVKLGKDRIAARSITFDYTRAVGEDSSAYRLAENTLMLWLNKTVYLIDKTNNLRVKIAVKNHTPQYDEGGHKISGTGSFNIILLDPFWEATVQDTYNDTLSSGENSFTLNNEGYLTSPPTITLTAGSAVTEIEIYVDETRDGIEISEDLLGTPGFEVAIIDCKEGTYFIEDIDRRNKLTEGTGFFELPVGLSNIFVTLDAGLDIQIDWRKRYFI